MEKQLIAIDIEASRKTLLVGDGPQLLYVLLNISSFENVPVARSPLNLCMVIDRSTSMNGRRLQSVKGATLNVYDELSSEDRFSLVTFSDRAEIVWAPGEARDRVSVYSAIERIAASGGTEIFQGLKLGLNQIRNSPLQDYTNHLVILTDGHTYGDNEACLTLAREAALDGITISAFGIGPDWNDRFLDELAGLSGGETTYLESPAQVHMDLRERIQRLGSTYARNLRFINDFRDGIILSSAFRVAPIAQPLSFNDKAVRLGYIRGNTPLSLLLEFNIEAEDTDSDIDIPLVVSADIPSLSVSNYTVKKSVSLTISDQESDLDPPATLLAAVQAWNFHRMNERAWDDMEAGNVELAQTRLRQLSTRLLEAGQPALANEILDESDRINQFTTVSLEGRKRLKYGTRALLANTVRLSEADNV